jgi:hypothetical protein
LEEKALRKVFKYEEKEYDVEMNKTKNKYSSTYVAVGSRLNKKKKNSILKLLLLLLLLTHGLVLFKLLYGLCRYALSAFVPPSVIPNLQKNIWRGQAIKQICE